MSNSLPPASYPEDKAKPQKPKPLAPPTSKLAVASLLLGGMTFVLWLVTGIPALFLGVMAIVRINKNPGLIRGKRLAGLGILCGLVGMYVPYGLMLLGVPSYVTSRDAVRRTQDFNNVKQLVIGIHCYHDVYKLFPYAGADANIGTEKRRSGAQLSWRVQILPYIEQRELYDQFHLDEPWDSPHNLSLIPQMPDVYRSPRRDLPEGFTSYMAVVPGKDVEPSLRTVLMPSKSLGLNVVTDGLSNTILILEAGEENACEWTKPQDLEVDWHQSAAKLPTDQRDGIVVGYADASVTILENGTSDEDFRSAVYANEEPWPPAD